MSKVKVNIVRVPISKSADMVWQYLLAYLADNNIMPTLQEIADNFSKDGKTYSREWARKALKELERQGKVEIEPGKLRGIRIKH